ncbi:hypothetical protein FOVG_06649 [Fusarium oxysporum f. sp. pisi HDV247]|uniref:Uncharacterized protein n=1 Tax=Fusarium oxysporum f. sp. pisi HDV247 TaxID=1080344 RepID=W9PRV9_FUSOX|nr:hypothetical protein FOVG_06649 [Fusarium oxysporum f. sp. pisi HDV247]
MLLRSTESTQSQKNMFSRSKFDIVSSPSIPRYVMEKALENWD